MQEVVLNPCTYITTQFLTPPVETVATMNVETGPKIQKHRNEQTIHEDVRILGGPQDMQDVDIIDGNTFSDKSGGRSQHASYAGAEHGWWRGRRR
jgi:hypothetical protein